MQFSIPFIVTDPFREELLPENIVYGNVTNLSFSETIDYTGTAPSEPNFQIIVNSATSITQIEIEMNNQTLTITENITAGDVLDIDMQDRTVVLN